MNEDLVQLLNKPHATVPDVGRICFGLSRNAAYAAANSGEIPSIRIGGRIVVPTAPLRKMLGLEGA